MPFNSEFRQQIADALRERRSSITDSSVKTYTSILFNLGRKMADPDEKNAKLEWFTRDHEDIIEFIQTHIHSAQTQKTTLSALYVLTESESYREPMMDIAKEVNESYRTQKRSTKQSMNQLTYEEITAKYAQLQAIAKKDPSREHLLDAVILCLMSGAGGILPRRNDWSLVKTKNFNRETDNYLAKDTVVFNQYKTAKDYGAQTVRLSGPVDPNEPSLGNVPPETMKLIRKWLKLNTTGWLLINPNTDQPLSSSDLSKRLKRIFDGRSIGCDNLRGAYLTHVYGNVPAISQMEARAKLMGHSVDAAMSYYVKKD